MIEFTEFTDWIESQDVYKICGWCDTGSDYDSHWEEVSLKEVIEAYNEREKLKTVKMNLDEVIRPSTDVERLEKMLKAYKESLS